MHLTVHLLIWLLVLCAIAGIVWYALQQIPLPPPIRIVVILVFCVIAILILVDLAEGGPGISVSALSQIPATLA